MTDAEDICLCPDEFEPNWQLIDEVRIYVRYKESERASLRQLANMRIRLPNNREYPLQEIATLTVKRGIMSINHLNTRRVIKVEADVSNPKESVTDLNANLKANIIPVLQERYPDLEFSFEGQSRESMKTKRSTLRVLPPILLLMFIIVVINFRSFGQAIIVFSLIPFGLVGIVWGHYIQGYILSVLSMFGMIALAGIMVNDALVLVSAMNQRLKDGQDFKTALYEAGISRFRPILLTSLTTIAGLGPLIFEKSFQAQFLSPMAISVAYGLLFATFLNLLLLPALLTLVNKFKVYGFWLFKGQKPQPKDVEPAVREEAFIKEL
jgi:multidrug efflux pump subunit AcrB